MIGAVDAAALGHSRNRPTATDEKTRKIFIMVDISLVGTISVNSIKIFATRYHILQIKCTKSAGGLIQRSPLPLACFKGFTS